MAIWKKLECGCTVGTGMLNRNGTGYCQTHRRTSAVVEDLSTVEWTPGRIAGAMHGPEFRPAKGRPEHRDDDFGTVGKALAGRED